MVAHDTLTLLGNLRWHWGSAYKIDYARGIWWAQRRDTRESLHADSDYELRELIIKDYTARPIPRSVGREYEQQEDKR